MNYELKNIFSFLKFIFIFVIYKIQGLETIEDIYIRFRIITKKTIGKYDVSNMTNLNMEEIIRDVDNLQSRLIKHIEKLDINKKTKLKLLYFFQNWSNLFLRLELMKLKSFFISEREFIQNVYDYIYCQSDVLKDLLEKEEQCKETKIILNCLDLLHLSKKYVYDFSSLEEIKYVISNILEMFDNVSNLINHIPYINNKKEKEEKQICYT